MPDTQVNLTSQSDDEIDLSELLTVLWHRKLLILCVSVSAFILWLDIC